MASLTPVVLCGDARHVPLADGSVHCVVTSPPYWGLRSYSGDAGMIGLEEMFDEHLVNLVSVFREVRRVLRDDGTLFLNYGDAYAGGGRSPDPSLNEGSKQATNDGSMGVKPSPLCGLKPKDLMMMPARVALALQADGWWLRFGDNLVETESYARERDGSAHVGPREGVPADEKAAILLRCGRGAEPPSRVNTSS